jgi:hypothetical protein
MVKTEKNETGCMIHPAGYSTIERQQGKIEIVIDG